VDVKADGLDKTNLYLTMVLFDPEADPNSIVNFVFYNQETLVPLNNVKHDEHSNGTIKHIIPHYFIPVKMGKLTRCFPSRNNL
jgi:agmatine/peptidylarginine deiminase